MIVGVWVCVPELGRRARLDMFPDLSGPTGTRRVPRAKDCVRRTALPYTCACAHKGAEMLYKSAFVTEVLTGMHDAVHMCRIRVMEAPSVK